MQQNLLFFMTDQQRADTINMVQCGQAVTPCLNAFANECTDFSHAYSTCPLCVPARTALATGVEPLISGMTLNALNSPTAPKIKTLHQTLYESGYEVAHIGVNHITVSPPLKSALPFAAWECDDSYADFAKKNGLDIARHSADVTVVSELCDGKYEPRPYSNANVSVWPYDTVQFKDMYFAQKAVEFIQSPHEKPFALFVYLWAPHPPLRVPKEYLDLFPPQDITLPLGIMHPANGEPPQRRLGAPAQLAAGLEESDWRLAWSAHCALVRLCDDAFSMVLNALKQNGVYDNTAIVFTADHGEQLGQHNMYQKMEMYESAVRIPALFRAPNGKSATFDTPISHLDFVPTTLDLLNLPFENYQGVSLKSCILHQAPPPSRDIFSVYCGNHKKGDTRRMIVRGHMKYVFDGDMAELYNLTTDASEQNNLAALFAYAHCVATLHEALQKHFGLFDYITY